MTARQIIELRDLLLKERDLLRAGYPVETISLVEKKTEIMQQLGPLIDAWEQGQVADHEVGDLKEIIALAEENALRFNAVRNGMRSLIERLSELSAGTQIGAYDESGKQLQFGRMVSGRPVVRTTQNKKARQSAGRCMGKINVQYSYK